MIIDGLKERIVWCFWFGEEMSQSRKACFNSIKNRNTNTILITEENLSKFIMKKDPLHKGYKFLSPTHKSDYLRSYFMYHYGGVYTDIKKQEFTYDEYYNLLELERELYCLGAPQTAPSQIANCKETLLTRKEFHKFSGCCNFMFRKGTFMALEWKKTINLKLDSVYHTLKNNSGLYHPRATKYGAQGERIEPRGYPLGWTEIHGDVFHPLSYKYSDKIKNILPHLSKENYR